MKTKNYEVTPKGLILGRFETRISDGARLVVDSNNEVTGQLIVSSEENFHCDTFKEALAEAKVNLLKVLEENYLAEKQAIMNM